LSNHPTRTSYSVIQSNFPLFSLFFFISSLLFFSLSLSLSPFPFLSSEQPASQDRYTLLSSKLFAFG